MDLLPNVEQEEKLEVTLSDEEVIDEPTKQDEEIPEIVEKEKIQVEEVFKKAELLPDAPTIKKVKRTRKMTPEAIEKLAIAREKALETRRKNAALRKEGKMPTKKQIKENKIKEEEEKEKEIAEEKKRPVINNITHETKHITNNITEEDIKRIALESSSRATQEALAGYEAVRKERKEAKRKKKEEENHRVNVAQTINKALGRNDPNFYDNCF